MIKMIDCGKADLHIHTTFSDSSLTPEDVVIRAKSLSLEIIAITDHDTIDGISWAKQCAAVHGIEIVSGVELSSQASAMDSTEIHILGLFIDPEAPLLVQKLNTMCRERRERIFKITQKLNDLDAKIDPHRVLSLAGLGSVGRMHVAQVLQEAGYVSTKSDAFRKYIGDHSPAYVPRKRLTTKEAIQLVLSAGGVPVMAHPGLTNRDELIPRLVQEGLGGIEAYYPIHSEPMTVAYVKLARKYHLCVSGGSDSHGDNKQISTMGKVTIPRRLVEDLRSRSEAHKLVE